MQGNCITVPLDLPGMCVERQREEGETLVISVRYSCMSRPCPRCGQRTSHVHQYHRQLKSHTPLWGKRVLLEVRKRRFRCPGCGLVFMEEDEVCGRRRRSTLALRRALAEGCRVATVKAVAAQAGVSEALVRRAFREMAPGMMPEVPHSPRVLALDEIWLGAGSGSCTVLYAPEERCVLDLRAGRSQASAEALLNLVGEDGGVEVVVMDMAEPFRQAVQYACPGAAIVADKFHVLAHVLAALGRVITRVRARAEGADARLLRRRRLFMVPSADLSPGERGERDRLLGLYPELAEAWRLSQAFRAIYDAGSRAEAARAMAQWWERVKREGPREFLSLQHMLTHWREEILNYFTYRVTNGFAEGKNNCIKAIIRAGYGYRNLENLTQRIMLANQSVRGG